MCGRVPFRGPLGWALQGRFAVTGGSTPLVESCVPSVSCRCVRGATSLVGRTLLRPRAPREAWSLEPSLSPSPRVRLAIAKHIHSWAFTLLQGVTGDHPSTASRRTRTAPTGAVPLMGFVSLQRSPARRIRFTRRFHPPAPCVLRVHSCEPLSTLCSPPGLPVVSDQAAPGIRTFRASFLPEIRRPCEQTRALLTLLSPIEPTLAVCSLGPGLLRG